MIAGNDVIFARPEIFLASDLKTATDQNKEYSHPDANSCAKDFGSPWFLYQADHPQYKGRDPHGNNKNKDGPDSH